MPTGGDGQHFRADGARATDVQGSVTNHQNLVTAQFAFQNPAATVASNRSDLISVFVVIGEGPGLKCLPKMVMAQFDFRAQSNITSKQPKHRRVRQGSQICDEFVNPGTDAARAFAQNVIKPEGIPLEKSLEILRRRRDVMKTEKLANEPHISAPSKLQTLETVHGIELGGKDFRERLHPRAAGADQRPVDVE